MSKTQVFVQQADGTARKVEVVSGGVVLLNPDEHLFIAASSDQAQVEAGAPGEVTIKLEGIGEFTVESVGEAPETIAMAPEVSVFKAPPSIVFETARSELADAALTHEALGVHKAGVDSTEFLNREVGEDFGMGQILDMAAFSALDGEALVGRKVAEESELDDNMLDVLAGDNEAEQVNRAPQSDPVTLPSTDEDTAITITTEQLLSRAYDVDGDPFFLTGLVLNDPAAGTLIDNGDGTWTFIPAADWNGTVTFSYQVSDGALSTTVTASLAVNPVNDAPTNDAVTLPSIAEDTSVTITTEQLLSQAFDVDGDTLFITNLVLNNPEAGTLVDNGDGTWTFIPAENWHGPLTFSYQISDGEYVIPVTASLTVNSVNDAPVIALNSELLVDDDATVSLTGSLKATDVDNSTSDLKYFITKAPLYGVLMVDGVAITDFSKAAFTQEDLDSDRVTFRFDPHVQDRVLVLDADSFVFKVTDGENTTGPATFNIQNTTVQVWGTGNDDDLTGLPTFNRAGAKFHVYGFDGNDILRGGSGADTLDGGEYASTDFSLPGQRYSLGITVPGATPGGDTVDYSASSAAVDVDLTRATQLSGHAEGDVLRGIENVTGSRYGDTLKGDAVNNVLAGLAGADLLDGGAGTDTADYRRSDAAVDVDLTRTGGQSSGHAEGDTLAGIENVIGSAFADSIVGNEGHNFLDGGAGNDTLLGGAGNDTLRGGTGADYLDGGTGPVNWRGEMSHDLADYSASDAAVNVDLTRTGAQSGGHAEGDTLVGIEDVLGSRFDDVIKGDAKDNRLWGGDGDDTMYGGGRYDTIMGGSGNDWIDGGTHEDSLFGGAGNDTIYGGNGIDTIFGGDGDDYLVGYNPDGSADRNQDLLIGGAGNDTLDASHECGRSWSTLVGGMGADRLIGNGTTTSASYELTGHGDFNVSWQGVYLDLRLQGLDENGNLRVQPGKPGGDDATGDILTGIVNAVGTNGSDTLIGNHQNNEMYGIDGNDLMIGGEGNDSLWGVNQNDTLEGGLGADFLWGGSEYDIASYEHAASGVNVSLEIQYGGRQVGTGEENGDELWYMDGLYGSSHNDTLTGCNTQDSIYKSAHNLIEGRGGNDIISGLAGNDTLDGGTGNDTLIGGAGNDSLLGGAGNDLIHAGAGDKVEGGAGFDVLRSEDAHLDATSSTTITGIERIDLTGVGEGLTVSGDAILKNGVVDPAGSGRMALVVSGDRGDAVTRVSGDGWTWTKVGQDVSLGDDGNTYVLYEAVKDGKTVRLYVQTGLGEGEITDNVIKITGTEGHDNLTVGWDFDDPQYTFNVRGLGGNDTLRGGSGADTLDGGGHAFASHTPWLYTQEGGDTVDYGASTAAVDIDLTRATQSGGHAVGDVLIGIENVTGSAYGDSIVGDAADNFLIGLAGDDRLTGGAGNDTLRGGAGLDVLDGGAGRDFADYRDSAGWVNVDLTKQDGTTAQTGGGAGNHAEGDTLIGIENVIGSAFADSILGNAGSNVIYSYGGNDTIDGGAGYDTINGGDGDDLISGGNNEDRIYGGAGNDTVYGGNGIDTIWGGDGDDYLVGYNPDGSADRNQDLLIGGAGNDTLDASHECGRSWSTLVGGMGADRLIGNGTTTSASYELTGHGDFDVSWQGVYLDLRRQGLDAGGNLMVQPGKPGGDDATGDILTGIVNAVGSNGHDTLIGNHQNNEMYGVDGNDLMIGGEGNDSLWGVNNNDTIEGGLGADFIWGGLDYDIASYEHAASGVNVSLDIQNGGLQSGTGEENGDELWYMDGLYGSEHNDTLTGRNSDDPSYMTSHNLIEGRGGNDIISGLAGNDTLDGGRGNDTLIGGRGNDSLLGGAGNDLIHAGAGDKVEGGAGFDVLRSEDAHLDVTSSTTITGIERIDLTGVGKNLTVNGDAILNNAMVDPAGSGRMALVVTGDQGDAVTRVSGDGWTWTKVGQDVPLGDDGNTYVLYEAVKDGKTVRLYVQTGLGEGEITDGVVKITGTEGHDDLNVGWNFDDPQYTFNVRGLGGNDTLRGGSGADTLDGGAGVDTADYHASATWVSVDLNLATAQTGGGANNHAAGDVLTGIENLTGTNDTAHGDVLMGDSLNNELHGLLGDDSLYGGVGDDTVYGGAGADLLDGGTNNWPGDMADYHDSATWVNIDLNLQDGSAAQVGGGDGNHALGDTLVGIEHLTGTNDTAHGDVLTGNTWHNLLIGLDGNDTLSGGNGNDTLIGGAGTDSLSGGANTDMVDYSASATWVNVDLNLTTAQTGGGDGNHALNDTLASIERVIGTNDTAHGDVLTGNGVSNWMSGLDGDDTMNGGGFYDTIYGGNGNDWIDGGTHEDSIFGGAGNDTIYGGRGIDSIWGGAGDDYLEGYYSSGMDGDQDLIIGGTGNDTLDGSHSSAWDSLCGGMGADRIIGNGIRTEVTYELTGYGDFDVSWQGVYVDLRLQGPDADGNLMVQPGKPGGDDATGDILTGIVHAVGSNGHDTLIGNHQNNEMYGVDGNDLLIGGEGNDSLWGVNNNDTLEGGLGADFIWGGMDYDIASYEHAASGVNVSLNIQNGGLQSGAGEENGDELWYMDGLYGSAFNDTLTGRNWDEADYMSIHNLIEGRGGDDIISGLAGNDTLDGGTGNDSLDGGTGNDLLIGGTGDDTLIGGDGNDTLVGGAGAHLLDGGAGSDIVDYSVSSAAISVDLSLAQFLDDTLVGIEGVIGTQYNDTLLGDGNDNVLEGGGGTDLLDGGAGNDTASYSTSSAAVFVDLNLAVQAGGGAGNHAVGDTLVSIESVIGSAFNDTLLGDGNDNVLAGLGGADSIDGGGGNNTADYSASSNWVNVDLGLATGQTGGGGGNHATGDTLVGFENVIGSQYGDVFTGDSHDNTLSGLGGDDRFVMGTNMTDADVIDGGVGVDQLNYTYNAADPNAVHALDHVTGVERIVLGDAATTIITTDGFATNNLYSPTRVVAIHADALTAGNALNLDCSADLSDAIGSGYYVTGSAGNDTMIGGAGNDSLVGNAGDDSLNGGGGDDAIHGGVGNDTLIGGTGVDLLNGGDGADTVDYSASSTWVNIDMSFATKQTGGGAGNHALDDTLVSIENLMGTNDTLHGDVLTGNNLNNVLSGLSGDDTLDGGLGDDLLQGGAGNDLLIGGVTDAAHGGDGFDTFRLEDNIGTGSIFDLSALNGANRITGIERIDITGDANDVNSLTLKADDVFQVSGGSLYVDGDAGDSVTTIGAGWSQQAGDVSFGGETYHHYTALYNSQTVNLYVDVDVTYQTHS